ncbi:MAG TPA: hypothetical protein EYH22_01425 [Candidatus Nanopusillus sp.]|nr:hypothetical protein [Candidatus Nanopusillus sp.]
MYYPIFSRDIEKFLGKPVTLIGKVIKMKVFKKYIDIQLLDPSGYCIVRSFESIDIPIFSSVLIVGTVREFKGKKYVALKYYSVLSPEEEIFWRINHLFMYKKINIGTISKRNLKNTNSIREEIVTSTESSIINKSGKKIRNMVIEAIDKLDRGSGVSIEDITAYTGLDRKIVERVIEELLAIGEIYEVSLGKLKILK